MNDKYTGRVAIITGASRGIGAEVARQMAERGARVALVARSEGPLRKLATELGAEKAMCFPLDVTDRAALLALPGQVVAAMGRLDILINNAGVNHRGPLHQRTAAQLTETIEANLVSPMLLTHAAIPHMRADGVVVNVASLAGKVPVPDEAAYSASKAGLRAFARALDMELELEGKSIRIKTVCPGPVDTAFFGEDLSKVPNLVFSQPMSTVTDIANSVLRLMEGEDQEESVPALSGKLTTMGYLLPNVYKTLRPMLELLGAYNKRVHLSRGGSGTR